jgi:hypothetical protein
MGTSSGQQDLVGQDVDGDGHNMANITIIRYEVQGKESGR